MGNVDMMELHGSAIIDGLWSPGGRRMLRVFGLSSMSFLVGGSQRFRRRFLCA